MSDSQYESELQMFNHYLRIEQKEGKLIWRRGARFGFEAGTVDKTEYKRFKLKGKMYYSHRVMWALHHGEMPAQEIDHINGFRQDNRIHNLRLCSRSENQANQKRSVKNKTGHKDVSYVEKLGLYRVRVSFNNKRHEFGYYKTLEDAAQAATFARKALHKEFANHD